MLKKLLFSVLLVTLLSSMNVEGTPAFQQLMRMDCDGTFELMPSFAGMAAKAPLFKNMVNSLVNTMKGRTQCVCPSSSQADFALYFDPVTAMLNNLNVNRQAPTDTCIGTNFPRNFYGLDLAKITLPSTCSYSTWSTQGTCAAQFTLSRIDATIQFGLGKCSNSYFPSVSLTCSGSGCSNLMKPCIADSDCGGTLTCGNFTQYFSQSTIDSDIFSFFKNIGVYGANDTSPGCYEASRGSGARTSSNDVFTNLFSFFGMTGYGLNSDYSQFQVCGIYEVVDFRVANFTINNTAAAGLSENLSTVSNFPENCILNNSTDRTLISIPGLTTWNGVDSTGTNVFTRGNYLTAATAQTVTAGATPLMQLTCDQNLVLPSNNGGMTLSPFLTSTAAHLMDLLRSLVACRSASSYNTFELFLTRYGAWTPFLWLGLLDNNAGDLHLPLESDWLRSWFHSSSPKITNLPTSCNYKNLVSYGSCQMDFTGLQSLLMIDVTLRITAKTCGSSSLAFSYTVECIGKDCSILTGITPCSSNAGCSSGLPCQGVVTFASNMAKALNATGFDSTKASNYLLNTDWIYLFTSSQYNPTLCSSPTFANCQTPNCNWADQVAGTTTNQQCSGPTQWQTDVNNWIFNLAGAPTASPLSSNPQLQFCLPDVSAMTSETVSTWAKNLVTVDSTNANLITLGSAFKNVGTTPTNAPNVATTTSAAPIAASLPLFTTYIALFLALFCLFLF